MEQHGITLRVQLMARRVGNYTVYVFKDLDSLKYITVSKCPNWNTQEIDVGQSGFLTYKFVKAGESSWWNKESGEFTAYQYSANYFLDFQPISHIINENIVTKNELLVG